MSEKRFTLEISSFSNDYLKFARVYDNGKLIGTGEMVDCLNEQQELIEELQVSDEMGWKRAEHFEKKFEKELRQKRIYIKRLEYKVEKFKEMNSEQQDTIEQKDKEIKGLEEKIQRIYVNVCSAMSEVIDDE